jgi:hypothetical protein
MQPDKNQSKSNFNFFFKMLKKDNLPLEAQKANIYKEIDHLLETDNKEGIDIFIKNGVKFTKKQVDTIVFKQENALIYQLDNQCLGVFTQNNKELVKELIVEKIQTYANFSKSNLLGKQYYSVDFKPKKKPFIFAYQKVVSLFASGYGLALFKGDEDKISKLYNLAFVIKRNLASDIASFKGASLDSDIKKLVMFTQTNFIEKIIPLYNEVHEEKLIEMAKVAKSVEIINIKDSIVHNLTEKVNNFDLNCLSSNNQKIFMEVASLCEELKEFQPSFNTTQALYFDNIVVKRIPQVIQEYITIPEKYRRTLEGKENPESLLEDSLKEIKISLTGLM